MDLRRIAMLAGVVVGLVGTLLPYLDFGFGGSEPRENLTYWELSYGGDVALLVLSVALVALISLRLDLLAAGVACAVGGFLIVNFIDGITVGAPGERVGFFVMPAGGALAALGGLLVLARAQRTTRAS